MYCIFSFSSRSEIMTLKSLAKTNGIAVKIVNTPSFVGGGCSLSIRCEHSDANALYSLFPKFSPRSFIGAFLLLDHAPYYRKIF